MMRNKTRVQTPHIRHYTKLLTPSNILHTLTMITNQPPGLTASPGSEGRYYIPNLIIRLQRYYEITN